MENLKSALIFEKYVVDKVEFTRNDEYSAEEKVNIQFSVAKDVQRIDNKMNVDLAVKVFENAKENNYPFEMYIQITGFFAIENDDKQIDFEPNAIAILYPYIRAIVSTYTANANVNPLILPPINVNNLFKEN